MKRYGRESHVLKPVQVHAPLALLGLVVALGIAAGGTAGCKDESTTDERRPQPEDAVEDLGGEGDTSEDPSVDEPDSVHDADAAADPDPDVQRDIEEPEPWSDHLLSADEIHALADPFIGTGGLGFGYAGLTPAVQRPSGLMKVGPDTTQRGAHLEQQHFSGYFARDAHVRAFSHVRLVGTGAADLGNLRLLPLRALPERPASPWTTLSDEEARYGWYSARLPDEALSVRLTADDFVAFHRIDAEGERPLVLLLDPISSITSRTSSFATLARTDGGFEGYLDFQGSFTGRQRGFRLFYSVSFSTAPTTAHQHHGESWQPWPDSDEASGDQVRVAFVWAPDPATGTPPPLEVRVGISLVDAENARAHREAWSGRSFEAAEAAAVAAWTERLGRMRFAAATRADAVRVATASANLWRMPSRLDEPDGRFRGLDGEVHRVPEGYRYYSDLSLWDSFRTTHPLYVLLDPLFARDTLFSLHHMAERQPRMPRWPAMLSETGSMLGEPAVMLFAEGVLKGIDGIDYERVLDLLERDAFGHPELGEAQRVGAADWVTLRYLPAEDFNESVSKTLELAWSDDALVRMATALGRTPHPEALVGRDNWRSILDPETLFFQPRLRDGTFARVEDLNRFGMRAGPYTEGNAWHWRFYPIWDPDGFRDAMGGPGALRDALLPFFEGSGIAQERPLDTSFPDRFYWHGNEPTLSAVWFFAWSSAPELASWWAHRIFERAYGTGVDGIPGNDDGGTLSAWLLGMAMGLYPIAGTEHYVISTPRLPQVAIDNGAFVLQIASEPSEVGEAPPRLVVDGTPWTGPLIDHATLRGASLLFSP